MPPKSTLPLKRQPLTLAQLSTYDDILTDALVDHAFYWTTIPKNRPSYHPSRGVKEEEIAKIIQSHLIVEPNLEVAETKLLATDGLRKFYQGLKTTKEKDDFRRHLHRYMQIYLPDCPFEVSSTNRYTIVSHEARVTARKFVKRGQPVKYLSGIQVLISPKEEEALSARKKDFSIVVSSRNKCASLFMGPARFANHDCGANARLMITGQAGIEIIATKNIEIGDEITVTYGESYFGEDNCECLCKTCEDNLANGWAQAGGSVVVKKSIEEAATDGYSLRRRRRDDSAASASRTPSVTPDIRPRVPKSRSKTSKVDSTRGSLAGSPGPESLLREKRKREFESLTTPPVTPAKRQKTLQYEVQSHSAPEALSRRSSDEDSVSGRSASESGSGDMVMTDVTTPESDSKEPALQSPEPSPEKLQALPLKREDSGTSLLLEVAPNQLMVQDQDSITAVPLPTIESTPKPTEIAEKMATADRNDSINIVEPITLPPPVTPVTNAAEDLIPTATVVPSPNAADESSTPDRGRTRTREEKPQECSAPKNMPSQRTRIPGDYTLTPVLLSEPDMAWVHCTICSEAFVQQNAYYTRSACPRCERHSKLYGYQWPKTEKEGPNDKEERVLDHRTIHRFLDPEDELRIRGRKLPSAKPRSATPAAAVVPVATTTTSSSETVAESVETVTLTPPETQAPVKRGRGRPRKYPRPPTNKDEAYVADRNCAAAAAEKEDGGPSQRMRQPSVRAALQPKGVLGRKRGDPLRQAYLPISHGAADEEYDGPRREGTFPFRGEMRRFIPRRQKAAATGVAVEYDEPERSAATASSSTKTFPLGIKLLYSPADPTVDIVFVHGLTDDREKTWTARERSEPWPKVLLPSELPTARVLTFGYDAYVADWREVVSQNRIGKHAWNLLASLASYREDDDTALVTLGQRPKRHLENILQSTGGIVFLGTPHYGAGLARWAELLSRSIGVIKQTNTEIVEVLKDESEMLARIQDSFHTMVMAHSGEGLRPIEISCFYEELPLPGVGQSRLAPSAPLPYLLAPRSGGPLRRPATRFDFTIAVICALPLEADAVDALFDCHWDDDGPPYDKAPGDPNAYSTGAVGRHNVVLVHMPGMGKVNAAIVAANCRTSFPNIKLAVVVGVCGVAPFSPDGDEIVLGDVIVSDGVIQYDLGRQLPNKFVRKDTLLDSLGRPNAEIRALLAKLKGVRGRKMLRDKIAGYLDALESESELAAQYPGIAYDRLFEATYHHASEGMLCEGCGCNGRLVPRRRLAQDSPRPAVHFSLIASGDRVMKSGVERDTIARQDGIVGFEMEGAGVWDIFPCVVIKGACDYADSHKTKTWQRYAAAAAAACMKAFLEYWVPSLPAMSVFWVHASNAERFHQAYASIAQECRIPGYDDPKTDVLPLVKSWLERKDCGRWLMIVDNADDTQLFFGQPVGPVNASASSHEGNLGRYLPECSHGAILVTTRNMQTGSRLTRGNRPIEVGKIKGSETGQLLRTRLNGVVITLSESMALSSRLEHLPLALIQAAAFIQENAITVSEYLRLLDKDDQDLVDLLSEEFETDGRDSDAPRAVAETWTLSFEQIQRDNAFAGQLLSLMSFFDRQAIPSEFLACYSKQQQGQKTRGKVQLTKALGVLKTFSFVAEDKSHGLNMHRLVQLVTRKWLVEKGTIRQFAEQALLTVSQVYPYGKYENRAICGVYLAHLYAVLKCEGTGSRYERLARASLLHNAAGFFLYQGQWKDAENFQMQATELRREVLGKEHPDTLTSIANLALTYSNQGRWKEAESLEVQVMKKKRRVLGKEHPDTLTSMANLASTYSDQGRWKEAESLEVQVMKIIKRVLGEEHPDTLTSITNLAATYRGQGRWKEAESLEVQVIEKRKSVLGNEHPDTLTSMANLALTYWNQGRWKDAESLGVQAMEMSKRVLGEEHPRTLTNMANLALTYWKQGRWKDAESLGWQVMEISKRVWGEEHPDTLTIMAILASIWNSQGRLEGALALMQDCLHLQQRGLGPNHPDMKSNLSLIKKWQKASNRP
ncbi:hypothetical protein DL764_000495 [Monosporascus ibericus]|uniref:SET domain-containing protein n=1 Tax=Monosporascus ibericus TaxID=155417 RepID=A0A4Q4TTA5_9PEZI|nr:hypothetical protein DL764_000495 [Monosporascus ibericus]